MTRDEHHAPIYVIDISGPVSARFFELFPEIVAEIETADLTRLRGPVRDGSQLVAIVDHLVSTNAMPVRVARVV